ncbi:hypothetical protein ACE1SV_63680 [Streptomyces sp. E-15]
MVPGLRKSLVRVVGTAADMHRLSKLGVQPAQTPSPAPAATRATKDPTKAQQAFQRGLAALAQWLEREGVHRPVPRKAVEGASP